MTASPPRQDVAGRLRRARGQAAACRPETWWVTTFLTLMAVGSVLGVNATSLAIAVSLYGTPVFEAFGIVSAVITPTTSMLFAVIGP